MRQVDQEVDALVRERIALLGGGARPPARSSASFDPALNLNDPALRRPVPPTTNPAASEIRFTPADESRDSEARLAAFTREMEGAAELDLPTAFRIAQESARELLTAEEDYLLAAIRLLQQRHLWHPDVALSIAAQVNAAHGATRPSATALNVVNEVSLTQRLPFGGEVAAAYVYALTENLRGAVGSGFTSSNQLILSGRVPLLRGAGDVAREDLLQAERELVYAARRFEEFRRRFLVALAKDYFDLVQLRAEIENQENALRLLRGLEQRTAALVEAGRLAEFQRNIAASDVLRATAVLASLNERFTLQLDRFKVRLGLPPDARVTIRRDTLALPEPRIDPAAAAALALQYRLDLQTQRDRVDDAARAVRNAENGLLPDLDLVGSVALRNDPTRTGRDLLAINPTDAAYTGGVRYRLALDRDPERQAVRAATIALAQARRAYEQLRDEVIVEARSRVREIDRARFALSLQEQAVVINLRRRQEQELKADEVTPQQVVDTANALRDAENARDRAVNDLRNAVLDYLLSTGQLRVARDGTLEPLAGMSAPAAPDDPSPGPGTSPGVSPDPAPGSG
jgi:outer membrane protein TolC